MTERDQIKRLSYKIGFYDGAAFVAFVVLVVLVISVLLD